jgi:2-polyprenyl-3-methyl-5-hydroxy-6-metoxy-1,4-benzoquinol methylase
VLPDSLNPYKGKPVDPKQIDLQMKNLLSKVLRGLGIEVRRVPRSRLFSRSVSSSERLTVNQTLRRFAETQPPESPLSNFKKLRAYLSDYRISFFHELLDITNNLGIAFTNRRVADVGCGTGYLLHLIENTSNPSGLTGFDTFTEMNELARLFCPSGTVHDSPLEAVEEKFDVIFCTEVLEHMTNPTAALRSMFQCLSDTGVLILTVPDGRQDQHSAGQMREDGSAHWGHVNFWSPESWPRFLQQSVDGPSNIHTCLLASGENVAAIWR